MLFNSYIFIFLFLPVTLVGFQLISGFRSQRATTLWLITCSLFFYSWWNPAYLALLLFSMAFNYYLGTRLGHCRATEPYRKKALLVSGVVVNLCLLGYFKYANFFVNTLNDLLGASMHLEKIILPLAISFFTFQQIAYLVDAYRGETREYDFWRYSLFVTFFPQLIAGPIVHHQQMMPQLRHSFRLGLRANNLAVGTGLFIIGLFKKLIIADQLAEHTVPIFTAVEAGYSLSGGEAWIGVLAYTLQLYFDFSGYADMALGLGRMFGVYLPINFHSPYKARNIADFWRHWHITLSRFLRDYIYFPLGGNRRGTLITLRNLTLTMGLGGLWHGAGWNFTLWGLMHGFFLVIYTLWQKIKTKMAWQKKSRLADLLALITTQLCFALSLVLFRCESPAGAGRVYQGLFGVNGFALPEKYLDKWGSVAGWLSNQGVAFQALPFYDSNTVIFHIILLFIITATAPNSMELFADHHNNHYREVQASRITLRFTLLSMALFAWMAFYCIIHLTKITEFLYFNF